MQFINKLAIASTLGGIFLSGWASAHPLFNTTDLTPKQQMASQLYNTKKLVLTVDDGPSPYTKDLLKILRDNNVKGTFFVIGSKVQKYAEAMRMTSDDGHIVANHTFNHEPSRYKDDAEKLRAEMLITHQTVSPYLRENHKLYFRAPQGAWKQNWFEVLNSNSIIKDYKGPVFWDIGGALVQKGTFTKKVVAAADWACWQKGVSVQKCAEGYMNETRTKNGGILLMHDVDKKSTELLAILIPQLLAEGYEFISLDDVKID